MPFLHVRTHALDEAVDAAVAAGRVRAAFAAGAGVAEEHVAVTWQALDAAAGAYRVLVELLAPDLNGPERVEAMLRAAGEAVAREAGVAPEEVFVDARLARSGAVLDAGELVRW